MPFPARFLCRCVPALLWSLRAVAQPDAPADAPTAAVPAAAIPAATQPAASALPAAAPASATQASPLRDKPAKDAAGSAVPSLPSFAELQDRGARIGRIVISARDIFDLDNPREDKLLFRWANALHIGTRPGVIERALLFASGEPVSLPLIEETARVLRSNRYLYDVTIRPVAVDTVNNTVDIEVITRDTWSFDPGVTAGRQGGANTSGLRMHEYNLLGTGIGLSLGRSRSMDRTGTEYSLVNDRAFGGWTSLSFSHANNSDGRKTTASVAHPFYALDTPWAAGLRWSDDDRLEALYRGGEVDHRWRRQQRAGEFFAGVSTGRAGGWVRRLSLGLSYGTDRWSPEPGEPAPDTLPPEEKLVVPFVRLQLLEDDFRTLYNRNQVLRPETFALGLDASVQWGRAVKSLGSTGQPWLYSASASRGFDLGAGQLLVASSALDGRWESGRIFQQQLGAKLQYYRPQSHRWLFYAAASGDRLTHPGPTDELLLGADTGLRGWPARYQSGTRRALFTVEERAYSDVYLWELLRFGGAVFADLGRAWGGEDAHNTRNGWLSNVGIGLRIFSVRAAFSNVLHLDLALPNDPDVSVKKVQFNVKTKTSF